MTAQAQRVEGLLVAPHHNGIWSIGLNRPAKHNPLTVEILDGIAAELERLTSDGASAVVLHGCGRSFSAGGDVRAIQAMTSDEERRVYLEGYARVGDAIASAPFPVIAALHGAVYGGGLELACMSDFRVAAPSARLCAADIAIGMVPTGGLTWRLPRLLGPGRAAWALLTNAVIDADAALRLGLCDVLSDEDADVLDAALETAATIAAYPADAVAATKQALRLAEQGSLVDSVKFEVEADVARLTSPAVVGLLDKMFPPKPQRSDDDGV